MNYPEDSILGKHHLCKTGHAIKADTSGRMFICRKGDKSIDEEESNFKRDESGKPCEYYTFNSTSNPDNSTKVTDYSTCGFNKNQNAFCKKRKGDKWYQDALVEVNKIDLTTFDCHSTSTISECYDLQQKVSKSVWRDWNKALKEVDPSYGYNLYAQNDQCISKAVTTTFWQDTSPDAAFNMQMMSSLAIVFNLVALFYLF